MLDIVRILQSGQEDEISLTSRKVERISGSKKIKKSMSKIGLPEVYYRKSVGPVCGPL